MERAEQLAYACAAARVSAHGLQDAPATALDFVVP